MNLQIIFNGLKSINYWDSAPEFNLGYIRNKYLDTLWKSVGNSLIKVITGQRRNGKSYILRQLIHKLITEKNVSPANILYINKEMFEFEQIENATDFSAVLDFYEITLMPKGKIYVFIDEVQDIINWEKIVVSLAQHPVRKYEFFITGSNSTMLSGELASLISGRYLLTEIFPFSYYEYLDFLNLTNSKSNFVDYISTSALPELFNLSGDETKIHYFQTLKDTILLKDIMYRNKIRDYKLLEDVFLFLLHNVGNMTSITAISKYFKSKNRKADYNTIAQFLQYMQDAYIISEASRYSLKTKEILSGERKYYISDTGFKNYLFPALQKDIGNILENIVYNHLQIAGYNIKVGVGNQSEIDFVAKKSETTYYIQVSYVMPDLKTIEREFNSLKKIKDNLPKIVVSMDDVIIKDDSGIIHKHIWDFIYELS